jgi:hypothetical protein
MSGTGSLKWPDVDSGLPMANSFRSLAVVVLALLIGAGAIGAGRGMAGSLQAPLTSATLLTAGVLAAAAGAIVRLGWLLPLATGRITWLDISVMVAATFAATALCSGVCSPPNSPEETALLVRVLIVGEESWAWLWFFRKWQRNGFRSAEGSPRSPVSETRCVGGCTATPPHPSVPVVLPEVTQQFTRCETPDGAEELSGWLRLPFAAGQRTGSIHVAFCPPLRVTPELEVEQIEGPQARIKTAQLLPFGARFDLKLAAPTEEPTTVLLQFTARTPRERAQGPAGA